MAGLGTKLHGKNGSIYVAPITNNVVGTPVKVVNRTEWTLNLNRDYVDATTFGNTNKVYLVGLKDISGTYAGLLDLSGDALVNATDSGAEYIYLWADDGVVTGSPVLVAHGPGLLDASITASISDAIKCTGNFRASGNWTVFKDGSLT
jgi:hypothetical protein